MTITDITITLPSGKYNPTKLLAYINVVFDGQLVVRGLRIVCLNDGQRAISMPSRKIPSSCQSCRRRVTWQDRSCPACNHPCDKRQFFADIAHPINQKFRDYITQAVLDRYDQFMSSK